MTYQKKDKSYKNPLSVKDRQIMLRYSNLCKKENILTPASRRYLFFAGKYESLFRYVIIEIISALEELEDLSIEVRGLDADLIMQLHYSFSFSLEKMEADFGNANSQVNCGDYYFYGRLGKKNIKKAVYWYELAAKQENVLAIFNLATIKGYEYKSKTLLENLASRGNPSAQLHLSYLVDNEERQLELLKLAASQENSEAQYVLAHKFQYGNGVKKNKPEAEKLYKKSYNGGDMMAGRALGYIAMNRSKYKLAIGYFEEAVKNLDRISARELGRMYLYGDVTEENNTLAVKYLKEAIRLDRRSFRRDGISEVGGEPYALLGQCFLNGYGVEKNLEQAEEFLKYGAELGESLAEYLLGYGYLEDSYFKQNDKKAFKFIKRAAKQDDQDAIKILIYLYKEGVGIKPNPQKALKWTNELEETDDDNEKYERAVEIQEIKSQLDHSKKIETPSNIENNSNVIYGNFPNSSTTQNSLNSKSNDIKSLIEKGEGHCLEFKSSMRCDLNSAEPHPYIELQLVKAIAGMLNQQGGNILVGINDNQEVLGLNSDFKTFDNNSEKSLAKLKDNFLQRLGQLINECFGKDVGLRIKRELISIDKKELCKIDIRASERPIAFRFSSAMKKRLRAFHARDGKIKSKDDILSDFSEKCFVRNGNTTDSLTPIEAARWAINHFGSDE